MARFPTFKGSWPWPWIESYCIPSCITHWPLPTCKISLKSKKRFCGRTDVRTDGSTFETGFNRSILSKTRFKKLWMINRTQNYHRWQATTTNLVYSWRFKLSYGLRVIVYLCMSVTDNGCWYIVVKHLNKSRRFWYEHYPHRTTTMCQRWVRSAHRRRDLPKGQVIARSPTHE